MNSPAPAKKSQSPPTPVQAAPAKVFHRINIISLLLMMTSGLQIYNANPVFGGRGGWQFPKVFLLGGWLAGGSQPLPVENGAPIRLASPIKLGYKQSKWVTRITLVNQLLPARGYWEDLGYEWYAGL